MPTREADTSEMSQKTNVLWLIKGLGPGGAENLLLAAARMRDREQFDYEVGYLLAWKDALVPALEGHGVVSHCFDVRDERDLRWLRRLRKLLRSKRFHVVHVHSPYVAAMARLVVGTLPRRSRPAIVSTEHNAWTSFKAPTRLANAWTAWMDSATIAVSEEARVSMSRRQRRRCETLVHGIDIDQVAAFRKGRQDVRREFGLSDSCVVVGTVANYHPKKDWPNLLHAARIVADSGADVKFLAVGQGPLQTDVEALHRELNLESTVTLTGFRPDAVRVMAACDIFVMGSKWEGLPVALMEATALGLPIVATAVGGIAEHFAKPGDAILVPAESAMELAQAVLRVAQDASLRESLAESSKAHAADFDAGRAQRRIEAIYRKVAR